MKNFMDENFLLQTETAQKLYHEHAAKMPIIDYHCHLIPQMVADDYKFKSLTEIWLGGDHYKWRAMRTNGVDERFCTGKDTTDWEKFEKWAETVPYTFRNPLYHWTHLELKTAFGINKILNPQTAREIYDECNEKLSQPEYSARGMMRRYHVEAVCTTDDPIDSLEYHIKTRESGFEIKMLPTWRPDKAMAVEVPADFRSYVEKLAEVSGVTISNFDDMIAALRKRHDFFAEQGCRLSDHGIEEFYAEDYTDAEIKAIFNKVYGGAELTKDEILKFKSAMLVIFGEMDWEKGWTQQFHYGAIRNNNTKMFKLLGADTGFDSIGEFTTAKTCVQQIIEGCIDIAGEVGSQKIGDPVSKYKAGNIQEAIYAVESWYSWHSREDYRNNIYSIRNAYYGSLDGTVADNSISKIIEGSNSTLNNNVKQAINKAATTIWAIPQPFRNNINSSEAEEAMEACSDLETVLKELNSYIGSTASINSDAILQPVVKTYVEVVVLPTYASLKSKVDALYDAVIALSNSPSNTAFETACDAWLQARQPWEVSEAFLFGPVASLGLDPNMDSWPLDQNAIVQLLNSGDWDQLNWSGDYDEDNEGIAAAQNVRGFHTLEFLLFKDGQARKVK